MQNAVNQYGVRFVVHFTKAVNLLSIFQHGILPISTLQSRRIPYFWNDGYRLDGCYNASCFSIEMPNCKMFYKYRVQNPLVDWAVLVLRKEILWEKDCAFCVDNAASSIISHYKIDERKGIDAFKRLYDEYPNKPSRKELNIPKAWPTNPQAEVLVFGEVEPFYIMGVVFENEETRNKYSHLIPENVIPEVQKWMFDSRSDYEYWR